MVTMSINFICMVLLVAADGNWPDIEFDPIDFLKAVQLAHTTNLHMQLRSAWNIFMKFKWECQMDDGARACTWKPFWIRYRK